MKWLDWTLPSPEENLACDEALLDLCEASSLDGILRFWEPLTYFVVMGYSNVARTEVDLEACRKQDIPVLRRISGGGTILQGPGCLNFSLVMPNESETPMTGISETNCAVLKRHSQAIGTALDTEIKVQGTSDLTKDDLKFSGNAQRRKRRYVLFHGTFLLNFDLPSIAKFLRMPTRRPDYRRDRSHTDFLTNLNISADVVKDALKKTWDANEDYRPNLDEQIRVLVQEKYSKDSWNLKY